MLKKILLLSVFLCALCGQGFAQNLTTVSGSNITDLNGAKLAIGQLCFQGTDQSDNPIAFGIGGGGQALKRQYCSAVTAGVVTSFTVPNPATTNPTGIYYRVRVVDSSTGQEVLRYQGVTFAGATFNFDNYTPVISGASLAPLTGNSVSGNLSVTGNGAFTGTVTGSNIPGSIPGAGACTNQFVRALNTAAPPTCNTVGSADLASGLTLAGITNTSNVIVNPVSTATGAALTVGGTSTTTGGMSIAIGALGASTERAAIVPADGSSAAFRVGALSVRAVSAGFLAGAELASLSSSGITFKTATGTLPATITNDTAGGIVATNSSGKQTRIIDSGGSLYIGQGGSLLMFGNTSGFTTIGTDAVASGNVAVKAGTYNVLGDTLTQTMSNKTLAGTTPFNRLRANQGTALASGNFVFSAGWGTTASIGSIAGTDSAFTFAMTSNGTGQAVNPTITLTFADGTWTNPPVCVASPGPIGGLNPIWIVSSISATQLVVFANFTPTAGVAYGAQVICVGK
ncbi:MAG TPA: hypothetical protein VGK24_09135 [Candidatus Angelobacter sp.]|jgi:hypothetical protein